jgi:hypothetical protein
MHRISVWMYVFVLLACSILPMAAQQPAAASANVAVPPMVNFSGVLADVNHKPLTGTVGVTFYLYQESQGGAPLWMETQNVQADKAGHYSVALGSTSSQGLPANVFATGEARWLGVQVQGQAEQPRVLLMSVPYALKALDAETIGGKPASAFMLAPAASGSSGKASNLSPGTITGSGTADFVPLFTGTTTIGNSKIFQTVGGDVGIGTTTPGAELDVKGTGDVRDTLTLFPKLTHPSLSVHGTTFEVSNTGKVTFIAGQTFPGTGTVTSVASGAGLTGGPITHSGTLSIANTGVTNAMLAHSSLTVNANSPLNGGGAVSLGGSTSLGLESCAANQILQFVSGAWACANPATGTVTSVATGLGLKGGTITTSGTLTIDTTVVPQLAANNTFSGTQNINNTENITVTNSTQGLFVNQGGSGNAIVGGTDNATGFGVKGFNISGTGAGVIGVSESTGGYGVQGQSPNLGVYGSSDGASKEGSGFGNAGLWGDTGAPADSGHAGILGTADENSAAEFYNNGSGFPTILVENDAESSNTAPVISAIGGFFGGTCTIDVSGDLTCSGKIGDAAAVDNGMRKVALYAVQSPENWFEDFGSSALHNGAVTVALDPTFTETVNTGIEYHVFLTPKGDSEGLYVSNETPQGFEVHEQRGGHSNIAFDYRIVAKRVGYENVRLQDLTEQFNKRETDRKNTRRRVRPSANPQTKATTPMPPLRAAAQPLAVVHK